MFSSGGGRATRFDKTNPLKTALIVDFIDEETEAKKKALLYGDVVGMGSCLLPEVEKSSKQISFARNQTFSLYQTTDKSISHRFLKDLEIHWYPEEVDAIIQENKIIKEQWEWKKEDELSVTDISKEIRIDYTTVNNIINRLQPAKQTQFYFDPLSKEKKRPSFQVVQRNVGGKNIRCLKKADLQKFCETYGFHEIKGPDDLSVIDVANEINTDPSHVRKIFKELKPVNKSKNVYCHQKNKKALFQIVTRRKAGDHAIQCLKREDLAKFRQLFCPYQYKQEDELSAWEISKRLNMKSDTVREIINRMQPAKNNQGLYFDPQSNSQQTVFFQIVTRRFTNINIRCLKEAELERFRQLYVPFLPKQKGELTALDISKRLQLDIKTCHKLLNRYQLFPGSQNLYFDPQEPGEKPTLIQIQIRRTKGGNTLCIKEESIKVFAALHGLKFRKVVKAL